MLLTILPIIPEKEIHEQSYRSSGTDNHNSSEVHMKGNWDNLGESYFTIYGGVYVC